MVAKDICWQGRTLLSAALLVALLSSCGGSSPSTEQAVARQQDASLIDQLLGQRTTEQLAFVEEEITLCMKADGFEYSPQPIDEVPDPYVANYYTLEYRETSGIGISLGATFDEGELSEGETENDQYLASLSTAEFEEWTIQEGRCFDEAWGAVEALFASATESLEPELVAEVSDVAFHSSSAFDAPMEQWSTCMRNLGFDFSDQVSMFIELQQEFDSIGGDPDRVAAFQQREIQAGVADLECYEQHIKEVAQEARNDLENRLEDAIGSTSIYD